MRRAGVACSQHQQHHLSTVSWTLPHSSSSSHLKLRADRHIRAAMLTCRFHSLNPSSRLSQRGTLVIRAARNPFKEAQRDLLPTGAPNTPVRRISYDIAHALTPRQLARLMQSKRHSAPQRIWRPKHEAAVLQRAADLVYYKALAGVRDLQLVSDLESLLCLSSEVAAINTEVTRQLEGDKIRRLLVACVRLGVTVPRALTDALLHELLRESGKKLPSTNATHMSDVVWALAVLRAGFHPPMAQADSALGPTRTMSPPAASSARPPGAFQTGFSGDRGMGAPGRLWDGRGGAGGGGVAADDDRGAGSWIPPPDFSAASSQLPASPGAASGMQPGGTPARAGGWGSEAGGSSGGQGLQRSGQGAGEGRPEAGLGPGAPAWEAAGEGSPLAWRELLRCTLLSLQLQQQQQHARRRQRQQQRQGKPEGSPAEGQEGQGPQQQPQEAAQPVRAPLPRAGRVNAEDLSRLAWGFAVAGCHDPELFRTIAEVARGLPRGLPTDKPRAVANLAYAFAKAGQPCPRLMGAICAAFAASMCAMQTAPEAATGSEMNGATALGPSTSDAPASASTSSGSSSSGAWNETAPSGSRRPSSGSADAGTDDATPQASHVAKVLWATAALQYKDERLLNTVAEVLPAASLRYTADELAHIAWALAQHGHYNPAVFEHLANHFVMQRMYGISSSQLAMLASSFTEVGHTNASFFRTIARLTAGRLDIIPCKDLVSLACCLASANHHNDLIMEAAVRAAKHELPTLSPLALAELVAALQVTGLHRLKSSLMTCVVMSQDQGQAQGRGRGKGQVWNGREGAGKQQERTADRFAGVVA